MKKEKTPSFLSLYALSALVFLISDAQGGVGPFISVYLKNFLSWDPGRIGLVLAVYNIAALIFQIPGGLITDLVTYKRLLIALCSAGVALGCLIIIHSTTLFPILSAQFIIGIATSIIPTAVTAITLGLVGREKFPSRLAINGTFNHAGNVTNTLLTGIMTFWFGIMWILQIDLIFSLASIIPLFLINKKEIDNEIAREAPENEDAQSIPIQRIVFTPIVILFGIAVILFTFANAAQLPLMAQKIANINPRIASIYMASSIIVAQVVMIGVTYLLSFVINKVGRKPLFIFSFVVLIIRAWLYTLTKDPKLLLLNQILDGLGAGVFSIVSVVIISDLAKNSGRFNFMLAFTIFCNNVGAAFSNLLSGYVAKSLGLDNGFIFLGLIAIVGLIFYVLLIPETKNKIFIQRNVT